MLYYIFCIEMAQDEHIFFNSTLAKIMALMEIHFKLKYGNANKEDKVIRTQDLNDIL